MPRAPSRAVGGRRACRDTVKAAGSGSTVPGELLPEGLCSSTAKTKPCKPRPRKPLSFSGSFLCQGSSAACLPLPSHLPAALPQMWVTPMQPPARGRTPCGSRVRTTAIHQPSRGQEPLRCNADLPLRRRGDISPRCLCQPALGFTTSSLPAAAGSLSQAERITL